MSAPNGTDAKAIDEGQIENVQLYSGYLVYRKDLGLQRTQIWAYDTENADKRLLIDVQDTNTHTGYADIASIKDGWVYIYVPKTAKKYYAV